MVNEMEEATKQTCNQKFKFIIYLTREDVIRESKREIEKRLQYVCVCLQRKQ